MKRPRGWRRIPFPFLADRVRRELDDEIQGHLEACTKALVARGMTPEAARAEALRRFGDVKGVRRRLMRDARVGGIGRAGLEQMGSVGGGFRRSLRTLARTPLVTLTTIVILAIGIGATTGFYALIDQVILRSMPFADPERVMQIEVKAGPDGSPSTILSPGLVLRWNDLVDGAEAVAAIGRETAALGTDNVPIRVRGFSTTASFFDVTGLQPVLGRRYFPEDDRPGAPRTVLLGHDLWAGVFDGDHGVLGTQITLDGLGHTVIGVMPAAAETLEGEADIWLPMGLDPGQRDNVGSLYLNGWVKLEPGAQVPSVIREMNAVVAAADVRTNAGELYEVLLTPVEEVLTRPYRAVMYLLFGATALVLLVGCGNVAVLLLARGAARRRELAVRMALGAGRRRLIGDLFGESLILGVVSGAIGLVVAGAVVRGVQGAVPFAVPRLHDAGIDLPIVAFGLLLSVLTAVVFGLLPAVRATTMDVQSTVARGTGGPTDGTGGRDRTRFTFLTLQSAFTLVLLVLAGLVGRTAAKLSEVAPGYQHEGVLTALVALPPERYPDVGAVVEQYGRLQSALLSVPGVEGAAIGSRVPLLGSTAGFGMLADGVEAPPVDTRLLIVGPSFFSTLGISLLAGREFTEADNRDSEKSVVINRAMALALGFDQNSALGRQVYASGGGPFVDEDGTPTRYTIVGVVSDVRDQGPRQLSRPELFFPMTQAPRDPWNWLGRQMVLAVRTDDDPTQLIVPIARTVQSIDAQLPLYDVAPLTERLRGALAQERLAALVMASLGMFALLLAGAGILGTVAYRVRRRIPEIGVRLALGATTGSVVRMIVRDGVTPVVLGTLIGIPTAVMLGHSLGSILYGVAPWDPLAVAVGVTTLVTGAWLAALIPGRMAARVDPVEALRSD